jgi:hypothetical protein
MVLMVVVALMVVMLAVSVAPAFARPSRETCIAIVGHQGGQAQIPRPCQA